MDTTVRSTSLHHLHECLADVHMIAEHMLCDHVDISQAFVQGNLLPGDGHNGKVYISPPPGFTEDDG
jgi:hypothetical protein